MKDIMSYKNHQIIMYLRKFWSNFKVPLMVVAGVSLLLVLFLLLFPTIQRAKESFHPFQDLLRLLVDIFLVPILEPREWFLREIKIAMMTNVVLIIFGLYAGFKFNLNLIRKRLKIKQHNNTWIFKGVYFLTSIVSATSTTFFYLPQIINFLKTL